MMTALFRALPLAVYRAFNGGMPVLVGLFIGSRWGLRTLGAYTVASAFLAVAVVVADWGSSRLLPREMARRDAEAAAIVRTSTAVRIILTLIALATGLLYAVIGNVDADVLPYLLVLAPVAFAAIVATNAVSARIVDDDLRGLTGAVAAGLIPITFAAIAWSSASYGALAVVGAYALGKWIETALLARGRWSLQRASFTGAAKVFALMLPFGASAIMGTLYSRFPVLVLERWSTREELGIVSAATALQNVMLLVPTAAALFIYPRLTVAAMKRDRSAVAETLRAYLVVCLLVYGGGLTALWLALARVTGVLDVPPAAAEFVFLYVAVGFITTINAMAAAVLQAIGAERRAAVIGLLVILVALPLQIASVRRWGMSGALAAVTMSEIAAMLLLFTTAWRLGRVVFQENGLRATVTTYGDR